MQFMPSAKPSSFFHSSAQLLKRWALFALVLTAGGWASAANDTWIGNTGSTDWVTPGNWSTGTPASNSGLYFGVAGSSGTTLTDSLTSTGFAVSSLTYNGGASAYTFTGNPFSLSSGGITNNSTSYEVIDNYISLGGSSGVTIATGGGSVNLAGNITASALSNFTATGGLLVASVVEDGMNVFGPGTILSGSNNLDGGNLAVGTAGNLILSGANSAGSGTSQVAGVTIGKQGVLTFGGSAALANTALAISESGTTGQYSGIVLDTNSSGAAVNQTVGSLTIGAQEGLELFQGHDVTSGSPDLIVTGVTTFVANGTRIVPLVASGGANFILNGLTTSGTGTSTLVLDGTSTGNSIAGAIANNGSELVALTKAGSGTWTLSGTDTYTGTTNISAGTLNLAFNVAANSLFTGNTASPSSNIIQSSDAITMGGGTLELTGASGATNSQTVASITGTTGTASGANTIELVSSGTSPSLTLTSTAAISRSTNNGTFNFVLNSTTADSVVDGTAASAFMGQWAFYGGVDYAYVNASNKVVSASSVGGLYTALPTTGTGSGSTYYTLGNTLTRLSGNFAFKGINITDATSGDYLDLGSVNLVDASSSILYSGGSSFTIKSGGGGALTDSSEMILYVSPSSTLSLDSSLPVTGSGVLTKSGAGELIVNGAKAFTGAVYIYQGILSTNSLALGGTASGIGASANSSGDLVINGGTLQYTGSGGSTDHIITIGTSGATLDASGTGAITFSGTPVVSLVNATQSLTLTGTSAYANTFSGVLANGNASGGSVPDGLLTLTKAGAGTWVLTAANTFTGGVNINAGILQVAPTVADTATAGALGSVGPITFGGGTLQYGNTNAFDYSNRFDNSSSAISIDTDGNNITYASVISSNNTGGLTLTDSAAGAHGSLTLSASNNYSGTTTVNSGGTLNIANTVSQGGGSATGSGAVNVQSGGTLAGGNTGGMLETLGTSSYAGTLQNYLPSSTGNIAGTLTIANGGTLAPGSNSVGTITTAALTLNPGSIENYQFSLTANSFTAVTGSNGFTLNGGGFDLYQVGTTTAFDTTGTYNLFSYSGAIQGTGISGLTVLNAQSGYTYTFLNDTTDNLVQLDIAAVPEPSTWALLLCGLVLLGAIPRAPWRITSPAGK